MYEIINSNEAKNDIANILYYSEMTFGFAQSIIYQENISQAYSKLSQMPGIGHHRKDIPANMRSLNVEQHCIIYEVNETKRQVFIVRVLHARMNFGELF